MTRTDELLQAEMFRKTISAFRTGERTWHNFSFLFLEIPTIFVHRNVHALLCKAATAVVSGVDDDLVARYAFRLAPQACPAGSAT
jgi:hypothetical protein